MEFTVRVHCMQYIRPVVEANYTSIIGSIIKQGYTETQTINHNIVYIVT